MLLLTTIFIIVLVFVLIEKRKKKSDKILGVYSQPGQWYFLKYVTFLLVLTIRKMKTKITKRLGKRGSSGLGESAYSEIEDLEKLQQLSEHEKAFDAVFFHAVDDSGYYLCGGIERRQKGKANGLLYLMVPKLGLLSNLRLPKTSMNVDALSLHHKKTYAAEGMCFTPVKPMKLWTISYNGKMKVNENSDNMVDVHLEADWFSDFPHFIFDTDMHSKPLARAIARETWSKEYFETLKTAHQTHYEQMGYLKGKLTVNGEKIYLNMKSFRDHSFGHKRDWTLMHRYIYHTIFLTDDTRISVGVISQPCTSSYLEMGYVITKDRKFHPIKDCDLILYQHGEGGTPPKEICCSVITDKDTYHILAISQRDAVHYKGDDVEARMVERFMTYEVNGLKGWGISEWHYNNIRN
ncbi:uncharacterized protein LOC108744721 [Agrilus planipennis]|uniref:Uncharacterized protein LOC108744721 n=1 Tax=Agrilus planipennis TaxID=224129 RepID=A0A1W4XUH6_AGRPL|nr:uncharacterized protein LOC108744721 [Agrilus planipennis]